MLKHFFTICSGADTDILDQCSKDEQTKYGFDSSSVAELNNKMVDDIMVILAEYRMALKKNNARREI